MKLFVSNLSYSATTADLEKLFGEVGVVKFAKIVTDRDTGRSRGFGFVEMETKEAAVEAINKLHESDLMGRKIIVSEARDRVDKPRLDDRQGGGQRYGNEQRYDSQRYDNGQRYDRDRDRKRY